MFFRFYLLILKYRSDIFAHGAGGDVSLVLLIVLLTGERFNINWLFWGMDGEKRHPEPYL